MIDLTTKSGKYRVIFDALGSGQLSVLRHGESWLVNPEGSKMLIELCCELEELRAAVVPK